MASQAEIQYVADMLARTKRPVIIACHGIRLAGACDLLARLAENWKFPVVTPIMGIVYYMIVIHVTLEVVWLYLWRHR